MGAAKESYKEQLSNIESQVKKSKRFTVLSGLVFLGVVAAMIACVKNTPDGITSAAHFGSSFLIGLIMLYIVIGALFIAALVIYMRLTHLRNSYLQEIAD